MEATNEDGNRIGLRVTAFSAMGEFISKLQNLIFCYAKLFLPILGNRKYMEDTFSVAYQKSDNGKDLDYAFFGIFDG